MDKGAESFENQRMNARCIIYVFSGTGNTRRVAEEYSKSLEIETEIYEITARYPLLPSPEEYSLVGIGYPVHAFNAPEIVVDFAKSLKCRSRKPLFIFHTGGEGLALNDSSSKHLRRILRKQFTILSERHYVMPYNMIFRHDDRMVKHMVTYMEKLVPLHAKKVMKGELERSKPMPLRSFISVILRIEWIYARLQGKTMKANDRCTSCGLCARNCPMGNIKIENGKPHFGTNCSLCIRCSLSCPTAAISIGILEGWKVNGPYPIDRIMRDNSIAETIEIKKLSLLYRNYYRKCRDELSISTP